MDFDSIFNCVRPRKGNTRSFYLLVFRSVFKNHISELDRSPERLARLFDVLSRTRRKITVNEFENTERTNIKPVISQTKCTFRLERNDGGALVGFARLHQLRLWKRLEEETLKWLNVGVFTFLCRGSVCFLVSAKSAVPGDRGRSKPAQCPEPSRLEQTQTSSGPLTRRTQT